MNTACVENPYFCPWDSRQAVVGNLSLLRQSGAKMIVGTDSGIGFCPFERYADGLIVLTDAGYTVREIVAGATDVAAKVTGLGNVTGRLAPGLEADLAAFEGNPLQNVRDFGKPVYVMARGREHVLTLIPEKVTQETARITAELIRKNAGLLMKDLNAVTVNAL
jgi:cytosine/adenosine deaminase-related metal-dependent hydrolase